MGLSAGTRLGPYEIQSPLGVGGMGEVYRARDTKLGRDVAIKILPEVFTSDPERLARFEREARMLAALNHPHIGAIYGVEDAVSVHALVLELVEGDTLGERLRRGPLLRTDALAIALQIAEALESAHERGSPEGDCSPGHQTCQPLDHRGWHGQDSRLRTGKVHQWWPGIRSRTIANGNRGCDVYRGDSRDRCLYESGAGPWKSR